MTESTRETLLLQTFAALADTLVADYDVVELLQTLVENCLELLDATAAGILLADSNGELEVIASTSESSRLVEAIQLSVEAGPGVESFQRARPVSVPDIERVEPTWTAFQQVARGVGFASVHTVPLRLRDTTIGALTLFRDERGELSEENLTTAQALADVATIGILHERSLRESAVVAEQLKAALTSRIIIEQAKGVVSHTHGVPVDEAFALIRGYARSTQQGLGTVAARIVDRSLRLP